MFEYLAAHDKICAVLDRLKVVYAAHPKDTGIDTNSSGIDASNANYRCREIHTSRHAALPQALKDPITLTASDIDNGHWINIVNEGVQGARKAPHKVFYDWIKRSVFVEDISDHEPILG
jgi:hypothetical protein